ncbi:MAG TPA: hypothetical protein VJ877_07755, partial [Bacteroidales bacterium]|nr:hypothetical protein [Bacteroidales bacterium]
ALARDPGQILRFAQDDRDYSLISFARDPGQILRFAQDDRDYSFALLTRDPGEEVASEQLLVNAGGIFIQRLLCL